jgi:hypothetical protein
MGPRARDGASDERWLPPARQLPPCSADCVAVSPVPVQAAPVCAPARSRRALMRYYGSFVACIAASLFLSVGPLQLLTPGTLRLRLSLLGKASPEKRPDHSAPIPPAALSRWPAVAFALEALIALG